MFGIPSLALLAIVSFTSGPASDEAVVAAQLPFYPLQTCLVSGQKLGGMGDPIDLVHEGRLVRFCCGGCIKKFTADAESYLGKLDAAVVSAQLPGYPLQTCVISGESFGGAMGDPVDVVHEGRLVRLCCKMCLKDFQSATAARLAKIDAALIAAQVSDYPLDTCPVSHEGLVDGDIVDMLYGTQLIRLCCPSCEKQVIENPQPVLAAIALAGAAHATRGRDAADHDGHDVSGDHGAHDSHAGGHAGGDGHADHGSHGEQDGGHGERQG